MICIRLDNLALRRVVSSLCILYRIYHGERSEELFDLQQVTAEFSDRTSSNIMYVTSSNINPSYINITVLPAAVPGAIKLMKEQQFIPQLLISSHNISIYYLKYVILGVNISQDTIRYKVLLNTPNKNYK